MSTVKRRTALVLTALLTLAGCTASSPAQLLVGQWQEEATSLGTKFAGHEVPTSAMITIFADGTATSAVTMVSPQSSFVIPFTWSLTPDGRVLKTQGTDGQPLVATVATLSKTTLHVTGPSQANGTFHRAR